MDYITAHREDLGGGINYQAVLSTTFSNEGAELVAVAEVKTPLAIDGNSFDTYLLLLISAARQQIEDYTNISLISRTIIATVKPGTPLPYLGKTFTVTNITEIDGTVLTTTYDELTSGNNLLVTYTTVGNDKSRFKLAVMQQVAYMYENRGDETGSRSIVFPGLSPIVRESLKGVRRIW